MDKIQTFQAKSWDTPFSRQEREKAIVAIEQGKVLYFPNLAFAIQDHEYTLFSPTYLASRAKNISYDLQSQTLRGVQKVNPLLMEMIDRFAKQARLLIEALFPFYHASLIPGRTSYRPAEIEGRVCSYRKDDTLLHVDAFPSTPNQGKRLLRVFTNVNPHGKPRIWRLGEPFEDVAHRFLPKIFKPFPGLHKLLKSLGLTKTQRTLYDHYMLHIHNHMKADFIYQKDVPQIEVAFPSQTTWVVMTDHVSHAATAGQHLLEQTFYLPVTGMMNEYLSPLRILEKLSKRRLA